MQLEIPESVTDQFFKAMLPVAEAAFAEVAKRESLPFWMKKGEAATYANVDATTLRSYIKAGLIRTTMKNGAERISKKAIDDFYSQHEY